MNNCTAEEFFKGKCGIENEKLSTENKDNLINNIISNIINGNLSSLLTEITEEGKDFFIQEDDIIFQITTTDNQKNNEYNNISSINIGECEGILKQKYNINQNLSLIILKVDYFIPGLLIPVIGYEVFHPLNNSKLNLKYCKNCSINYNIPVSIDENNIDKYDPNSAYYNDECSTSTTEDGTDITLNDRQNEYNENNMSLCENNCNFTEYDKETKKSICMCEIKSKIYTISEIISNEDSLSNNFNIEDNNNSTSNVGVMKCFNTLFSKYGLLKNIGNYILFFFIIIFSISGILFYKVGYVLLCNDIQEILSLKKGNSNQNDLNIYKKSKTNPNTKTKSKSKTKTNEIKKKKKDKTNNKKKSKKKDVKNPLKKKNKQFNLGADSILTNKELNSHKTSSKLVIKITNNTFKNKSRPKAISFLTKKSKIYEEDHNLVTKSHFLICELNSFSYKDALLYDKRTYFQYYISLLRTKHPLSFSFIPLKDYNSIIIKIDIFILSFSTIYAVNTLFFNDSTIHQIYKDKGDYNFSYFFPKALFSFLISNIINIIIRLIFLSERNILEIKSEQNRKKAINKNEKVRRCIIIKYILFFSIGSLFLLLFWYYLSAFCAVYQNSQVFLILNTFISFCISLVYPLFINIFPGIFRIYSLKNKNRKCIFNFSKIIQVL